jgi:hypothetical protein
MLCSVAEGAMDGREISIAEHRHKDTTLTNPSWIGSIVGVQPFPVLKKRRAKAQA